MSKLSEKLAALHDAGHLTTKEWMELEAKDAAVPELRARVADQEAFLRFLANEDNPELVDLDTVRAKINAHFSSVQRKANAATSYADIRDRYSALPNSQRSSEQIAAELLGISRDKLRRALNKK